MRSKSILAAFLCISILLAIPLTGHIFAAECIHNYEAKTIEATCISKEQIQYTCSLCGDSYSVFADEPTLPDSCYVLMKSVKADGQLTVTVTLENNPGIHSMRMKSEAYGRTANAQQALLLQKILLLMWHSTAVWQKTIAKTV